MNYPDELSIWIIHMNYPNELSRWIIQIDYSEWFSYLILILGVRFETGVSELQISNRVENVKRKTSSNSRIFTKARVNIKLSLGQIIRDTVYFEAESQFQSQAYFKTTIQMSNAIQGEYYVFRHLKCAICESLFRVKTKCIKNQIFIGILSTFSEKFFQIKHVWPQTWSEAILRIGTGLDHFYHWQPPKWILDNDVKLSQIQ